MDIEKEIAFICKNLSILNKKNIKNNKLFVYAAVAETEYPSLSYSYIMRKLRKGNKERRIEFQKEFKKEFDEALYNNLENPSEVALKAAINKIDFKD